MEGGFCDRDGACERASGAGSKVLLLDLKDSYKGVYLIIIPYTPYVFCVVFGICSAI